MRAGSDLDTGTPQSHRIILTFTDALEQSTASQSTISNQTYWHILRTNIPGTLQVNGSLRDYSILLKALDSEWTKEETDYLFVLVREFDVRWYVISDRYDYPGGQPRTMEVRPLYIIRELILKKIQDLKDRYASVCRKLIRNRPWAGDEASKSQVLSSFSFDKGTQLV